MWVLLLFLCATGSFSVRSWKIWLKNHNPNQRRQKKYVGRNRVYNDPIGRLAPPLIGVWAHPVGTLWAHILWAHPVNQYTPKSLRVHIKLNNGGYAITEGYKRKTRHL